MVELGRREAEKERPNENERSCFEVKRDAKVKIRGINSTHSRIVFWKT